MSTPSSTLDQSLGSLARSIPGATALFNHHDLDFCCAGNLSLRKAAAERGLDAAALAERLDAMRGAQPVGRDWRAAAPAELIEHIVSRYHARHRDQLPELVRLARRVEQVHGGRPDCPLGLAEHLEAMRQELESHMMKEEQILFPMLARGMREQAGGPISVMRFEHEQHGDALEGLDALTGGMVPPSGACNTWRALYLGLSALRDDLVAHIHLENNILFDESAAAEASHA
ncbi:iron-sulfur cluster repair protein YtfE [Burkholderiaceae bacterium FT117]|uniref:iron-sulfur cluster repair protein YtfE n=1 Tax=Zeimonas sediminis TaxID=2944268 RepID=UPI002342D3E8|nr:iron-sulfur cluster repair protein YtfE [Zeimonas sediminis]MCM5570157.1 iron-sulfur cluster repair protein YtfE [Zeimonas sediminis]